jgi:diguanylate cyclase (GGDEF)-like protein
VNVDITQYNYLKFIEILQDPLRKSRLERAPLALLIIQLHGVDKINSTYGYSVSNSLHVDVAAWLAKNLREIDSVYTLTNYKFGILLNNIRNEGHVKLAVNKLSTISNNLFSIEGHHLTTSISTGVALLESHDLEADKLLHNAETALNFAIKQGKSYVFHTNELDKKAAAEMDMLSELENALDKEEFEVVFQPKIKLNNHILYEVEALLRWNSEFYGPVSPGVFIPLIEQSPYMCNVTDFVLSRALFAQSQWPNEHGIISVAVNIPPIIVQQLEMENFIDQAFAIWGNDPSCLTLEITETCIMENPDQTSTLLTSLQNKGISISIDDFGTGYSSLSYFKTIPTNEIKIDKSFVLTMLEDNDNFRLVKAIIDLAHNFGYTAVAEGVENQETLDALEKLGCDGAQGYFISEALTQKDFLDWLHNYYN